MAVYTFTRVSTMIEGADNLSAGDIALTLGYTSALDGGGGRYNIVNSKPANEGGYVIYELSSGKYAILQTENGQLNMLACGLKNNGSTDNGELLQNFLDVHDYSLPPLFFPEGVYRFNTSVKLEYPVTMVGCYANYTAAYQPSGYGSSYRTTTFDFRKSDHTASYAHAAILFEVKQGGGYAYCTFKNIDFRAGLDFTSLTTVRDANIKWPYYNGKWGYLDGYTPTSGVRTIAIFCEYDSKRWNMINMENCAVHGFDIGVSTFRNASFHACTFSSCRIGIRQKAADAYYYDCSFSHGEYGIATEGHSCHIFNVWMDYLNRNGVCGDYITLNDIDTDGFSPSTSTAGGIYGYISGVFDLIAEAAIHTEGSSLYGLMIQARMSMVGTAWAQRNENDPEYVSAFNAAIASCGGNEAELFRLYSKNSAISIKHAKALTADIVLHPQYLSHSELGRKWWAPHYGINAKDIHRGSIRGTFSELGEEGLGTMDIFTPLLDVQNSHCTVDDGTQIMNIHIPDKKHGRMRISDAIEAASSLRKSTAPDDIKAFWLNRVDGEIADAMGVPAPVLNWPAVDSELLMPDPYDDIYVLYLVAMLDFYNQEMTLYANDLAIYNAELNNALAWWRREHPDTTKQNFRVM